MSKQVHITSGFSGKWARFVADVEENEKVIKITLKAYLGDLKEGEQEE